MQKLFPKPVLGIAAFLTAVALCNSFAQAQARGGPRAPERERFNTPHWAFDNRYHHNHYYPQIGYPVHALPPGRVAVQFRGQPFFFQAGVWFRPSGASFVVIRPPIGIIVPVLPPAYATVWAGGTPYYYANDVYYEQAPGGYEVMAPPADAEDSAQAPAAPPPQAGMPPNTGAPAQASGTWFYCDSAKAYYPYVSDCKEGWRAIPATPPQVR